jgi:long-chain acyl-CoA synthetase
MGQLIRGIAEARGDDVALIDERGETSWAEFDERTNRVINGLRDAGVPAGGTVALMSGNRRELFEATAACGQAGWLIVPVNWHWTAEELAYVLEDSDAVALVVEDQFAEVAVEAFSDPKTARCTTRVVIGDGVAQPDGFLVYEEMLAAASPDDPEDQAMGGPMFYTSGTTGFPKGVKGSLAQAGAPIEVVDLVSGMFVSMLGLPDESVTLLIGPAYHSAQWVFSVFPLLRGATLVMRHKFDPVEALQLIDEHQVTNVHLVPAQMIRMLKAPDDVKEAFDGSSLSVVYHGAAPCPPDVKRQMLEWWGPVVSEYYGGTEGGFLTVIHGDEWLSKPGSIGKPLDSVEMLILDDDGEPVAQGEPGQIYFKSLTGDFEYHKAPEKTAAAHHESGAGTLGDIGYADEDGFIFLSDRKIDMVISGGVNIYPAEVEGVLVTHPAVADSAVFGIPDDDMGESVKAAVELMDDFEASPELEAELIAHVRSKVAGYKAPKTIDFEDELPRTPTGKLLKRLLRDPYWEGTGRSI